MEELRSSSRNKRELLNARSGADITANKSSERLGEENRGNGEYPLLNQERNLHRHMYSNLGTAKPLLVLMIMKVIYNRCAQRPSSLMTEQKMLVIDLQNNEEIKYLNTGERCG